MSARSRRLPSGRLREQRGYSIIEVLVATVLLSLVSLGLASSTTTSYVTLKRTLRHAAATELAQSKMEELAAINPLSLSAANNATETGVISHAMTFTRTTTVAVNSDGSRLVTVAVTGDAVGMGGKATLASTFTPWGNS